MTANFWEIVALTVGGLTLFVAVLLWVIVNFIIGPRGSGTVGKCLAAGLGVALAFALFCLVIFVSKFLFYVLWFGTSAFIIDVIFDFRAKRTGRWVTFMMMAGLVLAIEGMLGAALLMEKKAKQTRVMNLPSDAYQQQALNRIYERLGGRHSLSYERETYAQGSQTQTSTLVRLRRLDGGLDMEIDLADAYDSGLSLDDVVTELNDRLDQTPTLQAMIARTQAVNAGTAPAWRLDCSAELCPVPGSVAQFYENFGAFKAIVPSTATQALVTASSASVGPIQRRAWDLVLTEAELEPLFPQAMAGKRQETDYVARMQTHEGDSDAERTIVTQDGAIKIALWVFNSDYEALQDYFNDKHNYPRNGNIGFELIIPEETTLPHRYLVMHRSEVNGQVHSLFHRQVWVEHVGFRVTFPNPPDPARRNALLQVADLQERKIREMLAQGS